MTADSIAIGPSLSNVSLTVLVVQAMALGSSFDGLPQ